ncbi:MAG: protein kinase domain-containing protein [Thermoanaerobaculia bacterium]
MNPSTESRLLRLAIAKGLLRWEDLDAVSDDLPEEGGGGSGHGRWIDALMAAGYLDGGTVAALEAEIEGTPEDATPDVTGGMRPWPAPGRPPEPPPSPFPPEMRFLAEWRRYRVEHLLGSGGMGTVYKAFDPTLGRWVALKFLHRNDEKQTERFLREARAQARVTHPNICQVHEVGEVDGRPYIAMQYIEGRSLGELCEELSVETKARIIRDVARAVHAAHRTGLIHRDLKPGNILLARDEGGEVHPYVVDFGLALAQEEASLSRTGMVSGTPAYISPEAAQGQQIDRRTDVYSLGVVLYELLAGLPPFTGGNLARILVRLVQEDAKPLRQVVPALPEDLETIVAKCLEKDPARRYESARDLSEDLDRFLDGEPIRARPAGWVYRARKRLRKNKALAIVSAAAVLALIVLGAVSLHAQWRERRQTEYALRFGERIGLLKAQMENEFERPLHDVTPFKRRLRQEMDAIRREMKGVGGSAEGPGHSALGQSYLALHQYERAREELERAWTAGDRRPEVGEALGLALGLTYERTVEDMDRAKDKVRREEAETAYLRPALGYLREVLKSSPDSPYLAGLVAFYEERYGDALRQLRPDRDSPRAAELEAKVYRAQARLAANQGDLERALALFDRAGGVYARLAARRPSDPNVYLGDCERRAGELQTFLVRQDVPREKLEEALTPCALALRVDPEMGDALVLRASMLWRLANQERKRGVDPAPVLAESIRLTERAIALDPLNGTAYGNLAAAHQVAIQSRMQRGLDVREDLDKSLAATQRAVELQPSSAAARNSLATAYLARALDGRRKGADPREDLQRAIRVYQEADRLKPGMVPTLIGLGNAWKTLAETEIEQGADPSAAIGRSVAALERALQANPSSNPVHNGLANAYLTLGEYLLDRGADSRAALTRAVQGYQRALAAKADDSNARYNLAYSYRSLAEALLRQGQDPGPALAEAGNAFDEAERLNPGDADILVERGRAALIAARWRLRQRQDPAPDLARATAVLARAEALNPQSSDVTLTQALAARWRAEGATGAARQTAVKEGLRRLAKALSIKADDARALALRGYLEFMQARLESDPAGRRERARQAVASFEQAFRINPLLQREYGEAFRDARLDAGLPAPRPDVQL